MAKQWVSFYYSPGTVFLCPLPPRRVIDVPRTPNHPPAECASPAHRPSAFSNRTVFDAAQNEYATLLLDRHKIQSVA